MPHPVKNPKKLIEVALPLDAINVAAAREKSIRHGHPSTLHLWWARRPLAAARAVIFSQLVNDPSWKWEMEHPGETPPSQMRASWASSRKRLFKIIEDLVLWENTTNEVVLEKAREEIRKSWRETCELNKGHPQAAELFDPNKLPAFHDPFAGGGAIPLEAQRLGLEAWASDLNPVAVLINKAMIEIPPKFAGITPIGPLPDDEPDTGNAQDLGKDFNKDWPGATGLAEDVRRYGRWMRDDAQKKIGHLYPPVEITEEMAKDRPDLKPLVGHKLTVIAWIWARTVKSPNPAYNYVDVPLASTFILSSKEGKEAYVQPVIKGDKYHFKVKLGKPPKGAFLGTKPGGSGYPFECLLSKVPIDFSYIRNEAKKKRIGNKLMAIVVEGDRGRIYLNPIDEIEMIATKASPGWVPNVPLPESALGFRVQEYGMLNWSDLFTSRQIVTLTTFCDSIKNVRLKIEQNLLPNNLAGGLIKNKISDSVTKAYSEAVGLYLSFAIDKLADLGNSLCRWEPVAQCPRQLFGRQTISMVWSFAEANPFSDSSGAWNVIIDGIINAFIKTWGIWTAKSAGYAIQMDAGQQQISKNKIVSSDPPYYDNIGFGDLSDFFYIWLRSSQKEVFPSLFQTVSVPKTEELVATPDRHGGVKGAEKYFLNGMTIALGCIAENAHEAFPVTIYYAYKQSENKSDKDSKNSGWETFLDALIKAGFSITGTWPIRTENESRMRGQSANALASSIILVCRKKNTQNPSVSRRVFIRELNTILPEALDEMTRGAGDKRSPVAPVDLSQAIIGPGMAVFSKYSAVLEADGTPMSVRTALQLINRFLAGDEFDDDTQFCLQWFEQYGWTAGAYGEAETLSKAKATSVNGLVEAGVLSSGSGKVKLLKWKDYPADWDPEKDTRMPVWEALHQLIRALKNEGEAEAGQILNHIQSKAGACRQLAYRLYTLCERAGWAEDARAYNEVVTSWPAIEKAVKGQKPGEFGFDEGETT